MSIRSRLTLWYVSVLAIVLVMFSATFYGFLKFSLTTEVDRVLQERAQQVAIGIQAENDPLSIILSGKINIPELDVFSSRSTFVQISNTEGVVIKRSFNLGEYYLPIDKDILSTISSQQPSLKTFSLGTTDMRLYTVPLTFRNEVIGMVQVGQPLNTVQETLQRIFLFLVAGTIIALIFATLFGVLLAQISLRPIDQITLTAEQIVSAQDLGQRLQVKGTNDELDRLSQTINNMLARLDNFFQSQIRLSADISHELRTPLTIVRGNVDLLRSGTISPEDRRETIGAIESALDRMARLVSDLLLLSKADAGMTLAIRPVDVDELILDVFQQVHALSNGVGLQLGHADYAATVQGDADRLKQLLINLFDNAIKHTPNGGHVTLSVYQEAEDIRICVSDTGEGIDNKHLPHIFDRFYQIKGKKHKGSGLGLAIAKWIAEAHNGSLTVESEVGVGSTFTLTLPLSK